MISYTAIEVQIVFKILLALVTSQLAIAGQFGREVYLWRAGNNSLDRDDLADEAIKNVFALFWEAVALLVEEALLCF